MLNYRKTVRFSDLITGSSIPKTSVTMYGISQEHSQLTNTTVEHNILSDFVIMLQLNWRKIGMDRQWQAVYLSFKALKIMY